ncbi:XRE family transcriptional regulator [Thiomicrospira microaerophila]|uniref:XRE family transcriptional regulator n=1 Tax=Thiomicrospira microaerophila TaxID=406020 RepID=UPI0005C9F2AB|nr:XRE family transcriptional regulator [Thiomicrospira microaerophila]
MIKNNKQLTLTKQRITEFAEVIEQLRLNGSDLSPLLAKAQLDALIAQKNTLEKEVYEYEKLISGEFDILDVETISDLPKALIRARISLGLTQKDLADRLGKKEQQIQRYENTDYQSASFSTLVSIVAALDLKVTEDIFLPKESRVKNLLLKKLSDAGLDKTFVERRISPRSVDVHDYSTWVEKTVERLTSIFGWSKEFLLGDSPLVIGRDASMVARFKMPASANEEYATAYTQYAYSIANIVAANIQSEIKPLSDDAQNVRNEIIQEYGEVNFTNAIQYVMGLGIPVISLNDSGAFHGATWRIDGRNVIVLKQKSRQTSKWLFDLMHEYYHATQSPDLKEFSVIELSETSEERRLDDEELRANAFAAKILLGDEAESYVAQCFKSARGNIAWLKNAVFQVAKKHDINCGVLAYQVARRLDEMSKEKGKEQNWWGAANNLQENECDPLALSQELLLKSTSMANMSEANRELLEQAFA